MDGRAEVGVVGARPTARTRLPRADAGRARGRRVPPDHPWAGRKQHHARGPRARAAASLREQGSGTRAALERALGAGRSDLGAFRVVGEMGSTQAIKQAVSAGVGVSIISRRAVEDECRAGCCGACASATSRLPRFLPGHAPRPEPVAAGPGLPSPSSNPSARPDASQSSQVLHGRESAPTSRSVSLPTPPAPAERPRWLLEISRRCWPGSGAGGTAERRDLLVGLGRADDAAVYRLDPRPGDRRDGRFLPAGRGRRLDLGRRRRGQRHVRRLRHGRRGAVRAGRGGLPARTSTRRSSPRSFAGAPRRWRRPGGSSRAVIRSSTPSRSTVSASPGASIPTASSSREASGPATACSCPSRSGTGVITTAAKNDKAPAGVLEGAVVSMLRLNRVAAAGGASSRRHRAPPTSPGFGLLGHAAEMVEASGAGVAFSASRLPLLAGAMALAEAGSFSGGMSRNRKHLDATFGSRLQIDASVPARPGVDAHGGRDLRGPALLGGARPVERRHRGLSRRPGRVLGGRRGSRRAGSPRPALSGATSIGPAPRGRDLTSDLPICLVQESL